MRVIQKHQVTMASTKPSEVLKKFIYTHHLCYSGFKPEQTKLREMELWHLGAVRSICNGSATRGMFQTLTNLDIFNCYFRGSLFTYDVAQCLFQLEDLHIFHFPFLERVIEARREIVNNKKTILPKLKYLFLRDLPILYKGSATIDFECPSLENLHVSNCPHLSFPTSAASDYFHSRNQVLFNDRHLPRSKFQMIACIEALTKKEKLRLLQQHQLQQLQKM